eukprot:1150897-Pelagomonas_calceolata.AAC.9
MMSSGKSIEEASVLHTAHTCAQGEMKTCILLEWKRARHRGTAQSSWLFSAADVGGQWLTQPDTNTDRCAGRE